MIIIKHVKDLFLKISYCMRIKNGLNTYFTTQFIALLN